MFAWWRLEELGPLLGRHAFWRLKNPSLLSFMLLCHRSIWAQDRAWHLKSRRVVEAGFSSGSTICGPMMKAD
jgi:hypothetical protein